MGYEADQINSLHIAIRKYFPELTRTIQEQNELTKATLLLQLVEQAEKMPGLLTVEERRMYLEVAKETMNKICKEDFKTAQKRRK